MDGGRSQSLGTVLGAFIGDALGAFIEFETDISAEDVERTMEMKGGGPFDLGPGQVTDDSELAMCMLRGLLDGQGVLSLDSIAYYYCRWVGCRPFDIGATTKAALDPLIYSGSSAGVCIDAAKRLNYASQSNGSLMRLTPLCVWAHRLPADQAAKAARLETSMTHSNETIQHAGACYVLAVRHLITHSGDREGAYQAAKAYAFTEGNDDIQSWFAHIETEPPMPARPKIGWAKIAFTHGFRHLRSNRSYLEAIRHTLAMGGDTDTNAAIVGGLMGAAVGYSNLPTDYIAKVISFTYKSKGGRRRPDFLDQTSVFMQTEQLFTIAPCVSTFLTLARSTVPLASLPA